jgi:hypothetical protein
LAFRVSALAIALAACTSLPSQSSPPTSPTAPVGIALPTLELSWPLPTPISCSGIGLGDKMTLQGSPETGVYALVDGTVRFLTEWPPGYVVQFTPSLRVLSPTGEGVAAGGMDLDHDHPVGLMACNTPIGPNGDRVVVMMLPAP